MNRFMAKIMIEMADKIGMANLTPKQKGAVAAAYAVRDGYKHGLENFDHKYAEAHA
jgi:hypothetical protein